MRQSVVVTSVVVCMMVVAAVSGLNFRVEPHGEECFYEDVNAGTHVAVHFQVTHGGGLDIDIAV